ncbi:MAG: ABC transporter ATP-binding protein [Capsulimonadaceae bacterium]|nr:ABC transporter ATP-binding protein [Capsulimonadaceae bacterium]
MTDLSSARDDTLLNVDKPQPADSTDLAREITILAEGLTKTFPGPKRTSITAVDGVALRVAAGEFYGFLGPNGAGKSTTIRMLSGLLRPTSGRIAIADLDPAVDPLAVRRVIGVLPEELSLYERLTGREFVTFAGRMQGIGVAESARRADELLQLTELSGDADRLIIDYSMGTKKKTALAGALIHAPKVLFLDEPFNGIDPLSARAIRDVLHRITQSGATIFFSSHVLEVVERLCDRVGIIAKGKIVAEGTIDELRAQSGGGDATLEDIFVKVVSGGLGTTAGELDWLGPS